MVQTVDAEWQRFMFRNSHADTTSDTDEEDPPISTTVSSLSTSTSTASFSSSPSPDPSAIHISTKSKIAYLTQPINMQIFWDIPVLAYSTPLEGVIKKQIKLNCKTPTELAAIQQRLQQEELYFDEHVTKHIDNPTGRVVFKDIRKISIGLSKKDILSYRLKKKQAFFNCFVVIFRMKWESVFREFHVKLFNSGKIEIPGLQTDDMFDQLLLHVQTMLQPFYDPSTLLSFGPKKDTVLINSNFTTGYFIHRDILYDILRNKYGISAIYDPCSYPGIKCKFYYDTTKGCHQGVLPREPIVGAVDEYGNTKRKRDRKDRQIMKDQQKQNRLIKKVSFMIFRTGSILIVGKCDESVLHDIYVFLKDLLNTEFPVICQRIVTPEDIDLKLKTKKKKTRKKCIKLLF